MTDTVLLLGSIAFTGYEVPPHIEGGGDQALAVHKLIGGTRVVDAMGADPKPISWGGRLQGPNAEYRLRQMEAARDKGEKLSLSWGTQRKLVVIKTVDWRWERFYQIPYTIVCEVVEDPAATAASGFGLNSSIADLVGTDTLNAVGLSDLIGDVKLGDAMANLQGAVSVAGAITGSTKIAALGGYLTAAQSAAGSVFSLTNGSVVSGALSLTGVIGRNAGSTIGAQAANMATLANVVQAQSLLSRVGINLGRGS